MSRCRAHGCDATIAFARTVAGRRIPLVPTTLEALGRFRVPPVVYRLEPAADPREEPHAREVAPAELHAHEGGLYLSHFIDCPGARECRRRR